ncbi:SLAP domain-containing protein [Lactobacillus intestinalis]|uniref:SLAP domain-containing protein n=1 Tax=Lactobacillus intestinalis TaxID=151781 RepID=UPI001F5671AB|nr:SLAP domain-containing protein [Lactobacillus intestinalis]
MKLSHKLIMLSTAALMGVTPVLGGVNTASVAQAATKSSKIVLGSNAYVYLKDGTRNKNYKVGDTAYPVIGKGAKLNAYGLITIKGVSYYSIGDGNYIKASNVATVDGKKATTATTSSTKKDTTKTDKKTTTKKDTSKKDTTNNTTTTSTNDDSEAKSIELSHNSYVYDKNGKRIKSAGTLKKGSKVSYVSLDTINSKKYYNLGKGQYIKAANAKATTPVKKNNKHVELTHNSYVYDKNGKRIKSAKTLKKGATFDYTGTKDINDVEYYDMGKGQYVKASNGVIVKSVELIKNSYVYDANGKRIKSAGTLKKGSTIDYYGTKMINDQNYYDMGKGQYIKTTNAKETEDTEPVKEDTYINLIKNAIIYNDNGDTYNEDSAPLLKGASYQALAAKKINDKWYYSIGDGQWIKAVNAVVTSGPALIPKSEDPNADYTNSTTDPNQLIATWTTSSPVYNSKGEIKPNQEFGKGHQARVSELRYIWIKSENQAVLFYKLVSDKDGFVKADDVTVSGKTLAPANDPEQAKNDAVVATDSDKASLISAINSADAAEKTDAYKFATDAAKTNFKQAYEAAQNARTSKTATISVVKNALDNLTKAIANLDGKKVPVTDLNNLTQSEKDAIIKLAARVNNAAESAIQFTSNTQLAINTPDGYQYLPVSDYATATPVATTPVNNN